MKILNALEDMRGRQGRRDAQRRPVDPAAPALADHAAHRAPLWRELGFGEDILDAPWPEPDPAALEQDEIELVCR